MLAVAILAAGKGTRMVSSLPKVLHKISNKTLLERVLITCNKLNPEKVYVIVGHKSKEVKSSIKGSKNFEFIIQEPQRGTGHAIQILSRHINEYDGNLLVLNGDVPLIKTETLKKLIKLHESENADVSILATKKKDPFGYGRVFTKGNLIERIIEEKDCDTNQRLNTLTNGGIYCFKWESLSKVIDNIKSNNEQNEVYLTDTISLMNKSIYLEIEDNGELQGINNRIHLSKCEEILQQSIKEKHMHNGVTFINPTSCTISEDSKIGIDVIIEANTHIRGNCKIDDNSKIGPNTFIQDTKVSKNCEIINSTIFNSEIMEKVNIGPYSHIRPNCKISSSSKIGNFVEIKNSQINQEVKINHLSYIGDSKIGKSTNIGAGTITANFDGINKHKTIIGNNSSIGANTVLIAPIKLGESVTTGAGSVITKDSQKNTLAIARSKQINIKNWVKKKK